MNQVPKPLEGRPIPQAVTSLEFQKEMEAENRRNEVKNSLVLFQGYDLRRANISMFVFSASVALFVAWVGMLTGAYYYRIALLVTLYPVFPVMGVLLCVALLVRNRHLYSDMGRILFAAMHHERKLWEHDLKEVRWSTAHKTAVDHMGLNGTTDPIRGAVFWPMLFFTALLVASFYASRLLNIPLGPT